MRGAPRKTKKAAHDPDLPKYSIAVASDLSGVPQQQLRRMEEAGLVAPARTHGKTRRYSDSDMARIDEVNDLASEGINAAGIHHILTLRGDLEQLRADNEALNRQVEALRSAGADTTATRKQPGVTRKNTRPSASDKTSRRGKSVGS